MGMRAGSSGRACTVLITQGRRVFVSHMLSFSWFLAMVPPVKQVAVNYVL